MIQKLPRLGLVESAHHPAWMMLAKSAAGILDY